MICAANCTEGCQETNKRQPNQQHAKMKQLIIKETSQNTFAYISKHIDVESVGSLIVATTTAFNIEKQFPTSFQSIVNLKRVNDFRWINKFFEAVNFKLEDGGHFMGSVETYSLRKQRILKKYPPIINWGIYTIDFFLRRVSPKVWGLKKIYFFMSRGQNRVISKAETLGRLYSCGFEIVEESYFEGKFHFIVKKIKDPVFDYNPTYGPFINLKRYGKNGKIIKVYKLRTMHAYSEYIQKYVYDKYGSSTGDKADNDFRITTVGRVFRKLWMDEWPMLINLVKGDIKLFGVRPLSLHKFDTYPKDLQEIRMKHKPGLVPPFYSDLPTGPMGLIDSERVYLEKYEKHPWRTDWRYFWKAFDNIVFKRARSN